MVILWLCLTSSVLLREGVESALKSVYWKESDEDVGIGLCLWVEGVTLE